MSRRLKDWILVIKKEFGILIEIIAIDPDELFADKIEFDSMIKVQALADWSMHNSERRVPLAVFDTEKIERFQDLQRMLQAG
jgi:hypothetical protein